MDNLHDFENKVPPLTIELCKKSKLFRDDYRYSDVRDFLVAQGYGDIGWANDAKVWDRLKNTDLKEVKFTEQYSNYTGSQTLYVNHEKKLIYSVDMGD